MDQISTLHQCNTNATTSRRRSRRFVIAVPAYFSWLGQDGAWHAGNGTTRDVSAEGVFVLARSAPAPGSAIEMCLSLPSAMAQGAAIQLQGAGFVLRVDPPYRQPEGFAANITFCFPEVEGRFDFDSEALNQ